MSWVSSPAHYHVARGRTKFDKPTPGDNASPTKGNADREPVTVHEVDVARVGLDPQRIHVVGPEGPPVPASIPRLPAIAIVPPLAATPHRLTRRTNLPGQGPIHPVMEIASALLLPTRSQPAEIRSSSASDNSRVLAIPSVTEPRLMASPAWAGARYVVLALIVPAGRSCPRESYGHR